jgi:hypothetical protein
LATIHIALLLSPGKRTPENAQRVTEIARSLGLIPTAIGNTSVSLRASPEVFRHLFGAEPEARPAVAAGRSDAGAPGGFAFEGPLPVPDPLSDLVESIAVLPPARRLNSAPR